MINSSEWKEFKIGDLFLVKNNPQLNKSSFNFSKNGEYPYFTRTVFNNGILGYVDYLDEEHKIKGNSIAVGMIAMKFFYMKQDFYAGQFTKTIYPKFDNFNDKIAKYFISIFNKNTPLYLKNFVVKDFEKDFTNTTIKLPITENGKIDFDFMENFIDKIEQKQRGILEFYKHKKQNGGGYELNSKTWKEFKIGDLFDVSGSKTTSKSYLEKIGKGDYPYITTQAINNGIAGFYNYFTEQENCLTIDSAVLGTCFWQNKNFSASDHVEILRPKNFTLNQKIALFFTSLLNKNASILGYSYGMKRNQSRIKNENILLPITANGEIDFEFMESFISGVQKISIKGVIGLKDKIIEQTKKAI
ncbi:restriction endonuclease subunit S [Campylobacter hyointestinalis]|uniref:restriction endonuclease subunit S n=1 Tax=Campylobacter hyointestinalis TaxID=198 RepID=UPI0015EC7339|nr:restriction endonuclease subunit S [Campylobacter hyointestinalis]